MIAGISSIGLTTYQICTKSNAGPRNYVCHECGKSCRDNHDLKKHVDGVHLKLKPFKCEYCDKSFDMGSNLDRHVLNKHEKIRHPCDFCDGNYSQKSHLARHIKKKHQNIELNDNFVIIR